MMTVKPELYLKSRVHEAAVAVKVENLLLPTTCSGNCLTANWGQPSPIQHVRARPSTAITPAATAVRKQKKHLKLGSVFRGRWRTRFFCSPN